MKKLMFISGIMLVLLLINTVQAFNPFSLEDWKNLIFSIFGTSEEWEDYGKGWKGKRFFVDRGTKSNRFYIERMDDGYGDRKYTPDCLAECHDVLNITPKHGIFNPKKLDELFAYVNPDVSNDFPDISYQTPIREKYFVNIPDYETKEECEYVPENKTTVCKNVTKQIGEHQEERERLNWIDITDLNINDLINIKKNKWFVVDVIGKRKGNLLGKKHSHVVPVINGIEFGELSWWNSSWGECFNITVPIIGNTNNMTNEPVSINLTGLTFTNASKEIRILDAGCSAGGSLTRWDIIQDSGNIGDGSEWAHLVFKFSNTSSSGHQNYSVYSDYSSASDDDSNRIPDGTEGTWSNYYNATVLPDKASVAWTQVESGGTSTIVSDLGHDRFRAYVASGENTWNIAWSATANSATYEVGFKNSGAYVCVYPECLGQFMQVWDGGRYLTLYINDSALVNDADKSEKFSYGDNSSYHVVRVTFQSANTSLYLDNVFKAKFTTATTGVNDFRMRTGNAMNWFDYVTYNTREVRPPAQAVQGVKEAGSNIPTIDKTTEPTDPSTYSPGQQYTFYANITDLDGGDISSVNFTFSGTTYQVSNYENTSATNWLYNYTLSDLAVQSNTAWEWCVNDTSNDNACNSTGSGFTVSQNTSTSSYMNLTLNSTETNVSGIYPFSINATGWYSSDFSGNDITFTLYRNDTTIGTANPIMENITLSNATWNYTYDTAGNVNYSATNKTFWFFQNKNSTEAIGWYLLDTHGDNTVTDSDMTITYPNNIQQVTAYWNTSAEGGYEPEVNNIQLFRNGTLAGDTSTETWCLTVYGHECARDLNPDLPADVYNYTAVKNASENYTSFSSTVYVFLNQNTSIEATLFLNDTENNVTYYQGDYGNFSANITNSTQTDTVYIDTNITGWVILSGTLSVNNITQLKDDGIFNITAYAHGNENYTGATTTYYAAMTPANHTVLNETYDATATSLAVEYFEIFVNTTGVQDVNATFYYNGTGYTVEEVTHQISYSNVHYNFSKALTIPSIDSTSDEITFNFTYTIYYWNETSMTTGTDHNQTVNIMNIMTCGGITNTTTLFFNMSDESNKAALNGSTIEAVLDIYNENATLNKNVSFSLTGNITHKLCIYPAYESYTIDATIRYFADDYPVRTYYLYQTDVSNTSTDMNLYLINDTDSDRVIFTLKDEDGDLLTDAFLKIQRFYTDTNSYITVSVSKSDHVGDAVNYLDLYDVYYKFIIEKSGVVLQTVPAMLVSTTDMTITISPTGKVEWFKYKDKIGYSCSHNEDTEILSCTVTDTGNLMTRGCLEVVKMGVLTDTVVCHECETSSSFTIGCNVGNISGQTHVYTLYADLNLNPINMTVLIKKTLEGLALPVYQLEGVLMTFLMVGTVAFVGIWSPTVAVLLMIVGLGMAKVLNLIALEWQYITGLALIATIIIYKARGKQ